MKMKITERSSKFFFARFFHSTRKRMKWHQQINYGTFIIANNVETSLLLIREVDKGKHRFSAYQQEIDAKLMCNWDRIVV